MPTKFPWQENGTSFTEIVTESSVKIQAYAIKVVKLSLIVFTFVLLLELLLHRYGRCREKDKAETNR